MFESTIRLPTDILIVSAHSLIVFEISLIGILIPPIEILFSPIEITKCPILLTVQIGVLFSQRSISWFLCDSQSYRIRIFLTKRQLFKSYKHIIHFNYKYELRDFPVGKTLQQVAVVRHKSDRQHRLLAIFFLLNWSQRQTTGTVKRGDLKILLNRTWKNPR